MRYSYKFLFISLIILGVVACSDKEGGVGPDPSPQLNINSVNPTSGPQGTVVTIEGSGFSNSASGNTVTFNGTAASVDSAAVDVITTKVPQGATSGEVKVIVDQDTATGPTFTVEASSPGISSVEPDNGPVGTKVTIKGMNFSATPAENTITFNGIKATVQSATEDQLETEVPMNATDGPIEVTVENKSTTGPDFDVQGPQIISVSPDTAVVGAEVFIEGKNFSENATDNILTFGGVQATVDSAAKDVLKAKVPEGAAGGPVSITVGELSDDADFSIITELQTCYGNDVQLDASLQWVSQGITTSDKDDKSQDMAIDENGNLYVVLRDRGTVGKFNPQGDKVWEANFDTKLKSTKWRAIETDGNSIYIAGERTVKTQDLGDAKLKYHFSTLKDGNSNTGITDPILARLDANTGSISWAQQFGSPDLDELHHETLAILPSGEILVAVKMSGPFTPSNHEPNSGTHDVAIAKFQQNGTMKTVEQVGAYTAPYSLTTDNSGRVFLGARNDDGKTVFARLNSDLQIQASSEQVTRQIKPPIPMPDGGAVVYGNTGTPVEPNVNVYIKDAYVQRLSSGGQEKWVHQQKFDDSGSTKYVDGVRMPGGGVVLAAQNASEIGGLPYLGIYADDGTPLFIDGSKRSTFFEFEDDKKGRGYPAAIESYRDSNGDIQVFTMGVTTSSWPYRNDDDNDDPHGGKDMWMTGMTLECTVTNDN